MEHHLISDELHQLTEPSKIDNLAFPGAQADTALSTQYRLTTL